MEGYLTTFGTEDQTFNRNSRRSYYDPGSLVTNSVLSNAIAIIPTEYGQYSDLAKIGMVVLPDSSVNNLVNSTDFTIYTFEEQGDLDDLLSAKDYIVTERHIRKYFASQSNEGKSSKFLKIKKRCVLEDLFDRKDYIEDLFNILQNVPDIKSFANKEPLPVPDIFADSNRGKIMRITEMGTKDSLIHTGIFIDITDESYWERRIIMYSPFNNFTMISVSLPLLTNAEILTELTPKHGDELFYQTYGEELVLEKFTTKLKIEQLKQISKYWKRQTLTIDSPERTVNFPNTYYQYVFFEKSGMITRIYTLDD